MKIDRIKWNMKGWRDLRKSAQVQEDLFDRAERIRDGCGDEGFSAWVFEGKNRARASVVAFHPHAIAKNAKHNTILNNLDRGRG